MRRSALLALCCCSCAPLVAGPGRVLPSALQYDPEDFAAELQPRPAVEAQRLRLDNGLEVFWVEEHSSPLVDVSVLVGCGRGDEPVGLPGLSGGLFDFGFSAGAGELDPVAQRRALERLALAPEAFEDDWESWTTFTVRSEQLPAAARLVAQALLEPRFEPQAVERGNAAAAAQFESKQVREAVFESALHQKVIAAGLPALGQAPTVEALRARAPAALRAHAARCVQVPNLAVAVYGDVTGPRLKEALGPFSALRGTAAVEHPVAAAAPTARALWVAPLTRPGRTDVMLTGPGLKTGSTEAAAAEVMMSVLDRELYGQLREALGDIYSFTDDVEVGPGGGVTWVRFSTRPEHAFQAVRQALRILEWGWTHFPIDEQSTAALAEALRRAPPEPSGVAFAAARAHLQHLDPTPRDARLAQVTAEQVRQFFVRALRPDRLHILVTGDLPAGAPWSELGATTVLSPPP